MKTRRPFVEEDLTHEERLALAWYRLNCWEWDEYIGPKPDGFDDLPYGAYYSIFSDKQTLSKSYYVLPVMTAIKETIGLYALEKFFYAYVAEGHIENFDHFDQWYFSIPVLKLARPELFPKVCKPPLLWRLRQKVQQWRSRL